MIRLFGLRAAVPQILGQGEPLVLYDPVIVSAAASTVIGTHTEEWVDGSREPSCHLEKASSLHGLHSAPFTEHTPLQRSPSAASGCFRAESCGR